MPIQLLVILELAKPLITSLSRGTNSECAGVVIPPLAFLLSQLIDGNTRIAQNHIAVQTLHIYCISQIDENTCIAKYWDAKICTDNWSHLLHESNIALLDRWEDQHCKALKYWDAQTRTAMFKSIACNIALTIDRWEHMQST